MSQTTERETATLYARLHQLQGAAVDKYAGPPQFEEEKHPRDGGQFSSTEGADTSPEAAGGVAAPSSPTPQSPGDAGKETRDKIRQSLATLKIQAASTIQRLQSKKHLAPEVAELAVATAHIVENAMHPGVLPIDSGEIGHFSEMLGHLGHKLNLVEATQAVGDYVSELSNSVPGAAALGGTMLAAASQLFSRDRYSFDPTDAPEFHEDVADLMAEHGAETVSATLLASMAHAESPSQALALTRDIVSGGDQTPQELDEEADEVDSTIQTNSAQELDAETAELAQAYRRLGEPARYRKWVPFRGPKGGSGWKNTETGAVIYGDQPPGERGREAPDDEMPKDRKRLTIQQANHVMSENGDKIIGGAGYDPKTKETSYNVEVGGIQKKLTADEIQQVIDDYGGESAQPAESPAGPQTPEDQAKWQEILKANPSLHQPGLEDDAQRFDAMHSAGKDLGLVGEELTDFVTYGMTFGKHGKLPDQTDKKPDISADETAETPEKQALEGSGSSDIKPELSPAEAKAAKYQHLLDLPLPEAIGREGVDRDEMDEKTGEPIRTVEFAGSQGIARTEMPQIPADNMGEFMAYLGAMGGTFSEKTESISASELAPTQKNGKKGKVMGMLEAMRAEKWDWDGTNPDIEAPPPIIVTNDGHILDGHHRWAAIKAWNAESGENRAINAITVDMPIKSVLKTTHTFDPTDYKTLGDKPGKPGKGAEQWQGEGVETHVHPEAISTTSKLLGRKVTEADLASVAGSPPGSTMTTRTSPAGETQILTNTEGHPFHSIRTVMTNEQGQPVMRMDWTRIKATKNGVGTASYHSQLAAQKRMGFASAIAQATRNDDPDPAKKMNGYYSLAAYGFDGPLPGSVKKKLLTAQGVPEGARNANTVQEILATQGGAGWWKANGDTFNATFDLSEGSASWQAFDDYIAHRREGKRKAPRAERLRKTGRMKRYQMAENEEKQGTHIEWDEDEEAAWEAVLEARVNASEENAVDTDQR